MTRNYYQAPLTNQVQNVRGLGGSGLEPLTWGFLV